MITKRQIEDLASQFKIDQSSIVREYLQLQFLNYLYQEKEAENIFFKGGTAIHLLLNSSRFSEDLDFSTKLDQQEIKNMIKSVQKKLNKELPGLTIFLLYQGKKSIRFRLKYSLSDFKYPFIIRLDFSLKEKPLDQAVSSPLLTNFPMAFFPIINHFSSQEMLVEKIRAFLARGKGRDIFDLWFLLEKKVPFKFKLVDQKLKQVGKKFDDQKLTQKIKKYPQKKMEQDLSRFLPQPQRKMIKTLKNRLVLVIKNTNLIESGQKVN